MISGVNLLLAIFTVVLLNINHMEPHTAILDTMVGLFLVFLGWCFGSVNRTV